MDSWPAPDIDRALESVHTFKAKMVPPDAFSEEEFRKRDAEVWATARGHAGRRTRQGAQPGDRETLAGGDVLMNSPVKKCRLTRMALT